MMQTFSIDGTMVGRYIADIALYGLAFMAWVTVVIGIAELCGFGYLFENNVLHGKPTLSDVVGITVLTPLIENTLLIGLICTFQKFLVSRRVILISCSVLAGGLHAFVIPAWGLTASMMFYLMARLFLKYQRYSVVTGFVAILLMHISLNTLGTLSAL